MNWRYVGCCVVRGLFSLLCQRRFELRPDRVGCLRRWQFTHECDAEFDRLILAATTLAYKQVFGDAARFRRREFVVTISG